jgi:hypothetical protein
MSGEKRPAQAAFGSANQLVVKRNKPDAELNPGTAVVKGSSQNGALVQSVCLPLGFCCLDLGSNCGLERPWLTPPYL